MDLPFQSQIEQFKRLPRAWHAAALAAALLVAWWCCEETVWAWARSYSDEAARLEELLDRGRNQSTRLTGSLRESVVAFGPARVPFNAAEGSARLGSAVNDVVKGHTVSNFSFDTRTGGKLPASALSGVLPGNARAERVVGEVQFESTPDEAFKIIAELDSRPEVDGISSIRMTRVDASKKVKVKLVVEAWVLGSPGPASRGSA